MKNSKIKRQNKRLNELFETGMLKPVHELASFFNQYLVRPKVIGALSPSSPFVAKAVAKKLTGETKSGRQILEIGAGTGVITKFLLKCLNKDDHLDLVECVPELVKSLKKQVKASGKEKQVQIHEVKIEEFHPQKKYDHIVSGLPLTSFSPDTVIQFYHKLDQELLKKDGLFSYYEYLGIPQIRLCYHALSRRFKPIPYEQFRTILQTKKGYLKSKPVEIDRVWFNFTPMRVVHVRQQEQQTLSA